MPRLVEVSTVPVEIRDAVLNQDFDFLSEDIEHFPLIMIDLDNENGVYRFQMGSLFA